MAVIVLGGMIGVPLAYLYGPVSSMDIKVTCNNCQNSDYPYLQTARPVIAFSGSINNNGQSSNLQAPTNADSYSWTLQRSGATPWSVSFTFQKNSTMGTLEVVACVNWGFCPFAVCSSGTVAGNPIVTGRSPSTAEGGRSDIKTCPDEG